ncbi:T9SS C-terminal target domain-containing protein [Aquimarina sp. BL5]|uniref:M14 family zinc carboxypeptidase n=1 Tax=Aquimarina sp. BL5 TaxID=1714860 RepID=UPI000E5093BC|nr:M14 family zinc carboxypeptidase [Aquimarina sp. BL5]AXT52652.1 T9SS C-terminal target domain-containing protein [Aquimarina sp. BL5]RKN11716.1 T9SS C-terminal target domain-containing protein [Aquimarina sp. BL5]
MKKKLTLALWVCMILGTSLFAQQTQKQRAIEYLNLKGEVIFDIVISNPSQLQSITQELSIVHYDEATGIVKLMANQMQFDQFLQKNIPFTTTQEDNIIGYRTMTSDLSVKAATFPLTAYPTYADYVSMMNDFATNNPTICQVENIGATTEGDKSLLFVKLSDNVGSNEQEPRVMYTSSMHGDEIAGYPMMLNLIDFLLTTYNDTSHPRHAEIKQLLDNNEVWINPLANPDGTYRNSANNTSVANATRGNANNVDLNRNYPDPDDGTNPDGNSHQIETQRFMDFAASKHFVLSANFHGGIELINYPWDTYAGAHPDEDYFVHVSEEYRDFCQQNSPNGYFDALNNGITNGYAWYEVQGGRQDYQIYYHKGREVTVELSNAKTPPANQLVNFWNYNQEALIGFLKQVNYGIRGVVTDAVTNQAIDAKVTVVGKETYETWTPTELPEGDYYRPIKSGTYTLVYEAECYESKTITGVTIADGQAVIQDVQLTPIGAVAPTGLVASSVQSTSASLSWSGSAGATFDVRYRETGTTNWTVVSANTNTTNLTNLTTETAYEVQVRSICAGATTSPYSSSITFTTTGVPACSGISTFPYTEGFESSVGVWVNATGDDINWTRDSNGTPSNGTGPSSAQEGSFYMFTEASGNGNGYPGKIALLDSPCVDLEALTGATLEFGYHMNGTNMGSLEVLVSTDNGVNYTSLWGRNGSQGDQWNQASIELSAYAGSVIKLQFKGTTGNGFRSDMAIDDLKIISTTPDTQAPSTPTNVTASNITGTTVDLSWNASTDNIGVSEYEIYEGTTLIATSTTANTTVSGLNPNSEYTLVIVAKDAAGNSSLASDSVTFTTSGVVITYCSSQGNNVNDEYIDYVSIGGIDNTSAATSGYTDYTNLTGAVSYGQNTIVLSLNYTGTVYTEYWNVWIDYNQDGTFDTSELIVSESTRSDANQSYDFTVPSSASTGATRMRVSLKYNATATPCETFTYGEVEDYTVNIGGATASRANVTSSLKTRGTLQLYPNPVTEGVLFISGLPRQDASITIYNYAGQKVISKEMTDGNIDVSSLSNGLYLLQVGNDADKKIKRFIIQ